MKKIFNFVFLIILFVVSFVAFFPKEKLYFLLQKELLVHNISIDSQKITDNPFSIELANSFILLSGSKIASIGKTNISIIGINMENINAINSFKNIVPNVKTINIKYSIGKFATIRGDFGEIIGYFDLSNKKVIFEAKIKKNIYEKYHTLFSNFKKIGDKYSYEFTF